MFRRQVKFGFQKFHPTRVRSAARCRNACALRIETRAGLPPPRFDDWNEHFANRDGKIIGLSAVGRTPVNLLEMNEDGRLQLRENVQ